MNLPQIRDQIDSLDHELVTLFCQRMMLTREVADYKAANNLPIHVPSREQEILERVKELAGPEFGDAASDLYEKIFELSKAYQNKWIQNV